MLSLTKLERLLATNGLVIKKIFTVDNMCVYIEVLCLSSADIFLLYIPSKYDISSTNQKNTYKITHLKIGKLDNIAEDYAGKPDNFELEDVYEDVDLDLTQDRAHKDDLEGHLEESYKRPLSMKDVSNDDTRDLKDVYRQLNRLRFCVQSIEYKLAIQFKNYMCCVRRDDSVDCFFIKHYNGSIDRKLFVIVNLETLYNKIESVEMDVNNVRHGVYKVLNKNQLSHARNLQRSFDEKKDISEFSEIIDQRKIEYNDYITKLETMLLQLCSVEMKIVEQLMNVQDKYKSTGIKGLHDDIAKSRELSKYENQLEKMGDTKQEIIKNILLLKTKQEDTYLRCDRAFFDNSVMLDAISKNMVQLQKI
jgi:hypothetical protein